MKLKSKKLLISSAALSFAVAPVAVAASCGSVTPAESTLKSNVAFDGSTKTIGDIINGLKSKTNTPVSTNLLNEVKSETTEALYNEEFTASKSLQLEYFNYEAQQFVERKWEVAQVVLTENNIVPTTSKSLDLKSADITRAKDLLTQAPNTTNTAMQARKTTIDGIEKQETELNNKITALREDIAGTKALDYSASNFTTNYPQILSPIANIKTAQTKSYNESKTAYIETYATRSEGEAAWVKNRASTYSNATTDEEAIRVLITNSIAATAFGRYTFAINSDFTVKQIKSGAFSFFGKTNNDYVFNSNGYFTKDPNNDNGKVYFFSRKTRDANLILVNPDNFSNVTSQNALALFASKKIIGLQHALIDIKAGTGDTLAWTVNKTTIKNLLSFYGSDSANNKVFELWKNMFQFPDKVATDDATFLKFFSNNEENTKEKNGNLGINSLANWTKSFDSGFGLGVISARTQQSGNNTTAYTAEEVGYGGSAAGVTLLNNLQAELEKTLTTVPLANKTTAEKNRAITQFIDNMSDDEFNKKYGVIFRDVFNADKKLVYEINKAANVYLVKTSFGLHIIKINEFAVAQTLQTQLNADLRLIATNDDTSKGIVDWATIFGQIYTNETIVTELINNASLMSQVKLNSSSAFKTANQTKWDSWISNNYIKEGEEILTKVRETIDNINRNAIIENAVSALSGKVTYLVSQIDSRFLEATIRPDRIYNAALEQMGATV